jgi:hypothetical protein
MHEAEIVESIPGRGWRSRVDRDRQHDGIKSAVRREHPEFFEDILPLLKWRCAGCHQSGGEGLEKSGLDLTTYEGVMKGTKFGRMVIAGSAGW